MFGTTQDIQYIPFNGFFLTVPYQAVLANHDVLRYISCENNIFVLFEESKNVKRNFLLITNILTVLKQVILTPTKTADFQIRSYKRPNLYKY